MIKQDIIEMYNLHKKYESEDSYSCLVSLLSKYLTSLNIENIRCNYEIVFYMNNKEYLLFMFNHRFKIFDKRKTINFNNEIELFEYIENKLLPEKDFKNE